MLRRLFGSKKELKLIPYRHGEVINAEDIHKKNINLLEQLIRLLEILFPNLDIPQIPDVPDEIEDEKITIPLGVRVIGAEKMWQDNLTGKGVLVGIIDSGIRDHPDLAGKVVYRKIFTRELGQPREVHGTHVAGTVAANGKIKGVAPDAQLADYRVLTNFGTGRIEWIIAGIKQAISDGCDVINMSLGGPSDYKPLRDALLEAYKADIPVIVAAGNEGDGRDRTDEYSYPAMYDFVFSVGSTNFNKIRTVPSTFSNSNAQVDCCSQGEEVISTGLRNNYLALSGTSMAAPHIAGAAALIIQKYRRESKSYTADDIYAELLSYAKDIYLPGRDNSTGEGFVTFDPSIFQ